MLSVARTIESAGYESPVGVRPFPHKFRSSPRRRRTRRGRSWPRSPRTTDTVRLGQMCTCNSYRPPSYLAKVASSIDVISGGRLEMGIGAGWYEHEYTGYGYEYPKGSVRLGMLREGVEIMRRLWTEDEVTFSGRYYQLDGAINQPKPAAATSPHSRSGSPVAASRSRFASAAEYAAYTNFVGSVETFDHKSRVLAGHCAEAGTEYEAIVRSSNFNVVCAETEAEVEDRIAWIKDRVTRVVGDAERGENAPASCSATWRGPPSNSSSGSRHTAMWE